MDPCIAQVGEGPRGAVEGLAAGGCLVAEGVDVVEVAEDLVGHAGLRVEGRLEGHVGVRDPHGAQLEVRAVHDALQHGAAAGHVGAQRRRRLRDGALQRARPAWRGEALQRVRARL